MHPRPQRADAARPLPGKGVTEYALEFSTETTCVDFPILCMGDVVFCNERAIWNDDSGAG